MRHAAGAICRPNCMQFAYTLSLPYKKCDYIISFRIALHCSRRVIPQLTKCAMGNARKFPSLSLSLLSFLLFHLFWHFSENKHQNIFNFGRVSLSISFSLDPHSCYGDRQRKFFFSLSRLSSLSSHSAFLQVFTLFLSLASSAFFFLLGYLWFPMASRRTLARYLFHNFWFIFIVLWHFSIVFK